MQLKKLCLPLLLLASGAVSSTPVDWTQTFALANSVPYFFTLHFVADDTNPTVITDFSGDLNINFGSTYTLSLLSPGSYTNNNNLFNPASLPGQIGWDTSGISFQDSSGALWNLRYDTMTIAEFGSPSTIRSGFSVNTISSPLGSSVPEIDALSGTAALSLVGLALLLTAERRRRA